MAVEGSTNKAVFETYLEHFLAPTLKGGQVVIMDNLSAHKGEKIRQLIEDKGCQLLYLPTYSADFKWDEKVRDRDSTRLLRWWAYGV